MLGVTQMVGWGDTDGTHNKERNKERTIVTYYISELIFTYSISDLLLQGSEGGHRRHNHFLVLF